MAEASSTANAHAARIAAAASNLIRLSVTSAKVRDTLNRREQMTTPTLEEIALTIRTELAFRLIGEGDDPVLRAAYGRHVTPEKFADRIKRLILESGK